MRYAFLFILVISGCSTAHTNIREQRPDEAYENYIASVVTDNGGYKPADYKCPDDFETVKFGDGYICPYWKDEVGRDEILTLIEFSIYVLFVAAAL